MAKKRKHRRCPQCGSPSPRHYCPSQNQIAARAAKLREGWDEEEYRKRAQGRFTGRERPSGKIEPWTPPVVLVGELERGTVE